MEKIDTLSKLEEEDSYTQYLEKHDKSELIEYVIAQNEIISGGWHTNYIIAFLAGVVLGLMLMYVNIGGM